MERPVTATASRSPPLPAAASGSSSAVRPAKPASAPQKPAESVNSVLSFFRDNEKPVQFDPSAIHAARPAADSSSAMEYKRGARVRHEQFGVGTILTMEGSGPDAKLTVYFDRLGSKKFVAQVREAHAGVISARLRGGRPECLVQYSCT